MMLILIQTIAVLQLLFQATAYVLNGPFSWRESKLLASQRPITYRSIEVPIAKRKDPVEVLIDEKNMDVFLELQKLISSGKKAQSDALEELTKKEAAFPINDPTSIELYEEASRLRSLLAVEAKVFRRPTNPFSNIDTFVNVGNDTNPFLIKSHLSQGEEKEWTDTELETFRSSHEGFHNITRLFEIERRMLKAAFIPEKLKEHKFSWQSSQWAKYLQHVSNSNRTSLSHAVIEYYKLTKSDTVGGGNFRRKPGYIGTLPPPEDDTIATGSHMLPKRVLHPWPAVTEFPIYVRWAPSHPRIPSINLMMARNGQFEESPLIRENENAIRPGTPKDPIYAGRSMEARDVARIARYAHEGRSYDPAIQIDHPGLLSDDHGKLPFYNAAHGPTMDMVDTIPDRDEAFWATILPSYDTTVLAEKHLPKRPMSRVNLLEVEQEEAERAARAKHVMSLFEDAPWRQEEKRAEDIFERNVRDKLQFIEGQLAERRLPSPMEVLMNNPLYRAMLMDQRHQRIAEWRKVVEDSDAEWQRLTAPVRSELTLFLSPDQQERQVEALKRVSSLFADNEAEILAHYTEGEEQESQAEREELLSETSDQQSAATLEENDTSGNHGLGDVDTQKFLEESFQEDEDSGFEKIFDNFSLQILREKPVEEISEKVRQKHFETHDWQRVRELSAQRTKLRSLLHMELSAKDESLEERIAAHPKGSIERQVAEVMAWREKMPPIEDHKWVELLQDLYADELHIEVVPEEALTEEQILTGTASVLPPHEREGPTGKAAYVADSKHWLDWEYDPLPPPIPAATATAASDVEDASKTLKSTKKGGASKPLPISNRLDSYRENASLRYDLQHGPLNALLPPEHNPLHRDAKYHAVDLMLLDCSARLEQEIDVPLGEDYLRTAKRSRFASQRRILQEYDAELERIDNDDSNLSHYSDTIRRLVRQTVRRRFPTLFERGFETLLEAMGLVDTKVPGSTSSFRKLKGSSKEEREMWQREFLRFYKTELIPRANRVLLKKFTQATARGYLHPMETPPSMDSSQIAFPLLSMEPSEEVAWIFTNPFAEKDSVKLKRKQIIENERKMRRLLQSADGMTKGPKEQLRYAIDIIDQLQKTTHRVRSERKVLMSYKIGGGEDGATRGRKSGKTRLPAAKVPPPKEAATETIVEATAKLLTNEVSKGFSFDDDL